MNTMNMAFLVCFICLVGLSCFVVAQAPTNLVLPAVISGQYFQPNTFGIIDSETKTTFESNSNTTLHSLLLLDSFNSASPTEATLNRDSVVSLSGSLYVNAGSILRLEQSSTITGDYGRFASTFVSIRGRLSFQYFDINSTQFQAYPSSTLTLSQGAVVDSSIISSNDATMRFGTVISKKTQWVLNNTAFNQSEGEIHLLESSHLLAINGSLLRFRLSAIVLTSASSFTLASSSLATADMVRIASNDSIVIIKDSSSITLSTGECQLHGSSNKWIVTNGSRSDVADFSAIGVDTIAIRDRSAGRFYSSSLFQDVALFECSLSTLAFEVGVQRFRSSNVQFRSCAASSLFSRLEFIDSATSLENSQIITTIAGVVVTGTNLRLANSSLQFRYSALIVDVSTIRMDKSSISLLNAGFNASRLILDATGSQLSINNGSISLFDSPNVNVRESNISITEGAMNIIRSTLSVGPASNVELLTWGRIIIDSSALSIIDSTVSNTVGIEVINGGSVHISGRIATSNFTQEPGTSSTLSNGTVVSDTYTISSNATLEGSGTIVGTVTNSGSLNVTDVIVVSHYNQKSSGSLFIQLPSLRNGTVSGIVSDSVHIVGGSISIGISSDPVGLGNFTVETPVISVAEGFGGLLISPGTQVFISKPPRSSRCDFSTRMSFSTLFVVAECQGGLNSDPDSPASANGDNGPKDVVLDSSSVNWLLIGGCIAGGVVLIAAVVLVVGFVFRKRYFGAHIRRLRTVRTHMGQK